MLTHSNFIHDIVGALQCFGAKISDKDSFLVVLPMFHAFSFTTNFVCPMVAGSQICFVQSLRTVAQDIKTLQPSVLMAVPLLAEKLYDKIEEGLKKSKVAHFLRKVGIRGPVNYIVRKKLGGRLRFMITGGAPCPHHVLAGFNKLHIRFLEGYGLTECSPVVSVCSPEMNAIGTIGKAVKGIQVRIAEPNEAGVGELQIKGPIVMKGYYHNDAATSEAFDGADGWFRTGDLASMDEDGVITIRGRKKALIVNREGKNIYPEEVENMIAKEPCVADILVLGYTEGGIPGEKVGAIVHPDEEWYKAKYKGKLPEWSEIEAMTIKAVQKQSANLADYKRVRKVVVYKEPLERTSVGKVRRVAYKGKLDE
ncbi:MAG: AMP-binding protein, partial [Kiritimatiellae bacterium]|nr:AMP-binding protein [Kiritimatiellia bacterium]